MRSHKNKINALTISKNKKSLNDFFITRKAEVLNPENQKFRVNSLILWLNAMSFS